jgi:hypothetical protein
VLHGLDRCSVIYRWLTALLKRVVIAALILLTSPLLHTTFRTSVGQTVNFIFLLALSVNFWMGSMTSNSFHSMSTPHKEIGSAESQDSGCTSLYLGSKHDASIRDISSRLDSIPTEPSLLWYKIRTYRQDAFSEFFGTMILILFGDGVVAQVLLSHGQKGDYQSISWGWG